MGTVSTDLGDSLAELDQHIAGLVRARERLAATKRHADGGTTLRHTPEPWHIESDTHGAIYHGDDPVVYLGWEEEPPNAAADYARIVACVNACAGIADPAAVLAEIREAYADAVSRSMLTIRLRRALLAIGGEAPDARR